MRILTVISLLMSISFTSSIPLNKKRQGNGRIVLSPNMRPFKNTKENLERYLRETMRRSIHESIHRPPIITFDVNEKNALDRLNEVFSDIDQKRIRQSKKKRENNRLRDNSEDVREEKRGNLKKARNLNGEGRVKTRENRISLRNTNSESSSATDSSSDEFTSRQKAVFQSWLQKQHCNASGATIQPITFNPEQKKLRPKNYHKISAKLSDMIRDMKWGLAYSKKPGFKEVFSKPVKRTGDVTTPKYVFEFGDLVV